MGTYGSEQRTITYGTYTFDWSSLKTNSTNNFSVVDSGKTLVSTTTRFDISGFLVSTTPSLFATKLKSFREALAKPRQNFSISFNGAATNWYDIKFEEKTKAGADILYGPNCIDFNIEEFIGGLACSYSITIEVTEKICSSGTTEDILQITKNVNYAINEAGFTVRTVSGILVVARQALPPDHFRSKVNIAVPSKFKRTSQTYTTLEDGITMKYSIVDTEQYNVLPKNIVQGGASFKMDTAFGAKLNITLSGSYGVKGNADKKLIFDAIIQLLRQYILPYKSRGFAFTRQEMSTNIYNNSIDFIFQGWTAGIVSSDTTALKETFDKLSERPKAVLATSGTGEGGVGVSASVTKGVTKASENIPQEGSAGLKSSTLSIDDGCPVSKATPSSFAPNDVPVRRSSGSSSGGASPTLKALGPISTAHSTYLYLDYNEKVSYEVNSNRMVFVPKTKNRKQIVMQDTVPTVYITQTGYATRMGAPPAVPPPTINKPKAYIMQYSICPSQPILQDNQKVYTTSWRYVIRVVDNHFNIQGIHAPKDPRITNNENRPLNIPSELSLDNL